MGKAEDEGDVAARLAAACARGDIKVLIVHGENDKVVPVANSRKLAKLIPGAELVEMSQCGHMPQVGAAMCGRAALWGGLCTCAGEVQSNGSKRTRGHGVSCCVLATLAT